MLDPIALSLYAKYKKGLLPPQIGAQLEDPRRLIMYDTFNRATSPAEGLGVSDSGHQWTTLDGSLYIPASTKLATPSSSGGIASVDIGGLQHGFTVHALLRSYRGTSRSHGLLIAWVDSQNYIVGRLTSSALVIRRIVGGVSTDVASISTAGSISSGSSWDWLSLRVLNVWDAEIADTIILSIGPLVVSYGLHNDPYAELFKDHIMPGIVFTHNLSRASRFYILSEAITSWAVE